MQFFNQAITVLGLVTEVNPDQRRFTLKLRSGDEFEVTTGPDTSYRVLTNLDWVDTDRVNAPEIASQDPVVYSTAKYVRQNDRIYVKGMMLEHEKIRYFSAKEIILMSNYQGEYIFENNTHWWLSQIRSFADKWLESLFGDSRSYDVNDFSKLYRTNLNIYGGRTDVDIQVMATLARLIYGLSSAYLLLGDKRFLDAAKAGVDFQRTAFRTLSHDGQTIIWSYGREMKRNGTRTIIESLNDDDLGTIPLYEQIYALSGLSQYFRITGDAAVLDDIIRTVRAFNTFFLDMKSTNPDFPGTDGYFSHIDPVTMRPDSDMLGDRKMRKNWNSIGDHIPAYLVNLILALDPLPHNAGGEIKEFLETCKEMVDRTVSLIVTKFPDKKSAYVNERFFADWKPDHAWRWQQNRAIIGHNLKIAWNLTRIAFYYDSQGRHEDAQRLIELAETIARKMQDKGLDQVRGGCFDAVERHPADSLPFELVWGNNKDFWQQEQGILAYLILFGYTNNKLYLELSRDMNAFWNTFHLDRENRGVYFRLTDNGMPWISGRGMAGYDIAGYHSFELNYLAHIYMRTYVDCPDEEKTCFCLYFCPGERTGFNSINVTPDLVGKNNLEIYCVYINGIERKHADPEMFQLELSKDDFGKEVVVQYKRKKKN